MIEQRGKRTQRKWGMGVLVNLALLIHATGAAAGIHTWDVVEVFSNSDGTIQYVELLDRGSANPLLGSEVGIGSSSISSSLTSFSWTGSVSPPTNTRSFLIATAAFAALPGAPVPDVIIPAANTPFFNSAGDTITFAAVDPLTFAAVPTNGVDSLTETSPNGPQVVGPNSPRNYLGASGSVNASAAVPSGSILGILLTMVLVTGVGFSSLGRRKSA